MDFLHRLAVILYVAVETIYRGALDIMKAASARHDARMAESLSRTANATWRRAQTEETAAVCSPIPPASQSKAGMNAVSFFRANRQSHNCRFSRFQLFKKFRGLEL
jgi:hypothetical protein